MEKFKILVVDDSKLIGERIKALLSGLEKISMVGQAVDYEEGLIMIKITKPDVVLLDINMPGKSGIDLLRVIKSKYRKIKVIMLTNYSSQYYRDICMGYGADFFLDKTTRFEEVESILKNIIPQ